MKLQEETEGFKLDRELMDVAIEDNKIVFIPNTIHFIVTGKSLWFIISFKLIRRYFLVYSEKEKTQRIYQ